MGQGSAGEHDCNIGFGKKYVLQILGVLRDHLAEPLIGGPIAFPKVCTTAGVWHSTSGPSPALGLRVVSYLVKQWIA